MAVAQKKSSAVSPWAVGANVTLMTLLAVLLVGGLQYIGYSYVAQADLTTSGINSLTPPTRAVLAELDADVQLTSLYFETDIEDPDQDRYRSTISDLLGLYAATNRKQIEVANINPLQDHDEFQELLASITELEKFKDESSAHRTAIDNFNGNLLPLVGERIRDDRLQLESLGTLADRDGRIVGEVQTLFTRLQDDLEFTRRGIEDALASEIPAYGAATSAIRQSCNTLIQAFKNVTNVGAQMQALAGQYAPAVEAFFAGAAVRYQDVISQLEAEQAQIDALEPLELEEIIRDLREPTGNVVLVKTAADARTVPFREIWPPVNPNTPSPGFSERSFNGEQKITAAILQLTSAEKPAVVFVRYGGPPLFTGGFMPGQPQPLYGNIKQQLEDVNFSVHEWDLQTTDQAPSIEPAPSRVIWVLLRPETAPQNPFQQNQQPPFTDQHLATLKAAMGVTPRAAVLTGFFPGFGGMPARNEYADYLRDEWGIVADADRILLFMEPIGPGKYRFVRDPLQMVDPRYDDAHPISANLARLRAVLPLVSPIAMADEVPEGVTLTRLGWFPEQEGLFSIDDIQHYAKQQSQEFLVSKETDYEGEFTFAIAAERGDAKLVIASATGFCTDNVALRTEMAITGQGLVLRPRNPGNAALFINTLHWLNDNTAFMDLGTPIDRATLAVEKGSSSMTAVRATVLAIWPGLALFCGLIVWQVRRR